MGYQIPKQNAFSINLLGNSPFPMAVTLRHIGNVYVLSLCPQRVIDIVDILNNFINDEVVMFGIDQISSLDSSMKPLTLKELSNNADIEYSIVDTNTIIIQIDSIEKFLSTFDHYNLQLFEL